GGSLDMWRSYFGPSCHIYGVDIEPACRAYADERTTIFIGDQADRGLWREIRAAVPELDVLIDDGGHMPDQMLVTLEEMLPHLRRGGVYICEDIHNTFHRFAAYVQGLALALNETRLVSTDPFVCEVNGVQ